MPANEMRDFVSAFTSGFEAGDAMAGRAQERKRKREKDASDLEVDRAKQEHAINRDTAAADARAIAQRETARHNAASEGAAATRNTLTPESNAEKAANNAAIGADRKIRTDAYVEGVKGRNDYYKNKADPNAGVEDFINKALEGWNGTPRVWVGDTYD